MKSYVELECENMSIISQGIYNFLKTETDILILSTPGWHFIDCLPLLKFVPELLEYFQKLKLYPRHSAITIVKDNNSLPLHIDELPVIAKINMPVLNTQGWSNRWFDGDHLVDELVGQTQPIVFNSQIPHSVVQVGEVVVPRIVASFTFHNEPLDLLK
jgi:hypothetical protein